MMSHKKILVAVDLSKESDQVVETASKLAGGDTSRLRLLFVLAPVMTSYPFAAGAVALGDLQEQATESAEKKLKQLAEKFDIPVDNVSVVVGAPASEIPAEAKAQQDDLIVLGSHGTSGWRMLLGSTASGVLNAAECDVLTVRIKSDD